MERVGGGGAASADRRNAAHSLITLAQQHPKGSSESPRAKVKIGKIAGGGWGGMGREDALVLGFGFVFSCNGRFVFMHLYIYCYVFFCFLSSLLFWGTHTLYSCCCNRWRGRIAYQALPWKPLFVDFIETWIGISSPSHTHTPPPLI